MQKTLRRTLGNRLVKTFSLTTPKPSPSPLAANLYNPHEQSREQLIESFVVRHDVYQDLYQSIKSSDMTRPEQHFLIEGQRGTGKTTLLLRLSYEVEDDPSLKFWLIPIVLKEEAYYAIRRLYALWKTIAKELAARDERFGGLSERMNAAYERAHDPIFHERNYEKACFEILLDALQRHSRKILLFIDNFGELLYNFTAQELYRLYRILKDCPSIRLIGASSIALEALVGDEDGFFYALFEKKYLRSLNKAETYDILRELGRSYKKEQAIRTLLEEHAGRVESLRILTGGVLRTIVLLFEIFIRQEESNALTDLDAVLDTVTPLYKHRMEILSPLQRDVVNAIAMNWEAIGVEDIARATNLHPEEVRTVLRDLEYVFLIETVGTNSLHCLYRLKERFFNIWYLMRLSIGSGQSRVGWLLHFLESWYSKAELTQLAEKHVKAVGTGACLPKSAFYLTEALVKARVLNPKQENRMICATRRMLSDNDSALAARSSSSDIEICREAQRYYQQERYEKAIPLFLKVKQKHEEIFFQIGYAFNQLAHHKQAVTYFLQAARLGSVEAMLHLGKLYDEHFQDYKKAGKFYSMAAGRGHTDAMLNLGNLYYYILRDYHSAEKYYLMVLQASRERSKVLNSRHFSLKYLKKYLISAIRGGVDASEAYQVEDFPRAQKNYLEALQKTSAEAMFHLGHLHRDHVRDLKKAASYYRMAAENGHVKAMLSLGDLYYEDQQDYPRAAHYYHAAAQAGDLSALVNLGFLYHSVFKEYKNAEKCYQLAAEHGDLNAMNGLACLYFQQRRNKELALHYARETVKAEKNLHTAHTAACIYLWNDYTIEAFDVAEAFMWSYEAYDTMEKDILFFLTLMLAKQCYRQVLCYFKSSALDLSERYKPLYYALLYFMGTSHFNRLPPELNEPVHDILSRVARMSQEYA